MRRGVFQQVWTWLALAIGVVFAVTASGAMAAPIVWTGKASMPTARSRAASGVINGKIFVLGGDSGASTAVEMYDPATDSWLAWTPLTQPVLAPCQVSLDDTIYMVGANSTEVIAYHTFIHGGNPNPPAVPVPTGVTETVGYLNNSRTGRAQAALVGKKMYVVGTGASMDRIEEFDLVTRTCITKNTRLPSGRDLPLVAAVEGKLYIMGGINAGNPATTMWQYDPAGDALVEIGTLPIPMAGNMVTTWGGRIYIAGAATNGTMPPVWDQTLREYDPRTGSWTDYGPVTTSRYAAAVQIWNGTLYVIGGDSGGTTPAILAVNEAATLPTGSPRWSVADTATPPVVHAAAAAVDGRIFMLGGRTQEHFYGHSEVYAFDPNATTPLWQRMPDLATPILAAPAAVFGSTIYLSGGEYNNISSDKIQYYDTATSPYSSGIAGTLRYPRARAGAAVLGGRLFVIGGGTAAIEEFDLTTSPVTRTERIDFLPEPLSQPTVATTGDRIYIMGGTPTTGPAAGVVSDICLIYDPSTTPGAITPCSTLPVALEENEGAALVDGKIYLVSGATGNGPYSSVVTAAIQVYDPVTDSWEVTDTVVTPRRDHSVAYSGGSIYVAGGWLNGAGAMATTTEAYTVPFTWRVYSYNGGTIDWSAALHPTVSAGNYLLIAGRYYYVMWSYAGSWNGPGFNAAALQQCDQYSGDPLMDGNGSPLPPDLGGTAGQAITVLQSWSQRIRPEWAVFSVDAGNPSGIDWPADAHGPVPEGSYLRIGATRYAVISSGSGSWHGSGFVHAYLSTCDQDTGEATPAIPADLTGDTGTAISFLPAWPQQHAITATTNGLGAVTCDSPVFEGEAAVCVIAPAPGFALREFTDNGTDVLTAVTDGRYTIAPVGADHAITARFAPTGATSVWSWGSNSSGELGDGTNIDRSAPVPVPGLDNVRQIAAANFYSAALKVDGSVWTWGSNGHGGLGDGTFISRNIPAPVPGLSDVRSIAAGFFHTLVIKDGGTVWRWGNYSFGPVPPDPALSVLDSNVPVQVTELADVVKVVGGAFHSLALKADGTVWTWGYNGHGQLGDGTTVNRTVPVQVVGISGAVAIAGGGGYSMALTADGTVWTWGAGIGAIPTPVPGLSDVAAIFGGGGHSLALKTDGTVWAWGNNYEGELGDGTNDMRTSPVQAIGLSGVTAIDGEPTSSLAVKSDGTAWEWGQYLVEGAYRQSNIPVQVQGLSGITAIAGGKDHRLVLQGALPDTEAPQVIRTRPAADESGLGRGIAITVIFSEPIDPVTVGATTLYLTGPEGSIAGSWTTAGSTATFTPATPLAAGAIYSASVAGIRDSAGNTLPSAYYWSFTTAAPEFSITASATGEGTVVCTSPVTGGSSASCSITPSAGHFLQALHDNGTDVTAAVAGGTYVVANVSADHALTATFAPILPPAVTGHFPAAGAVVPVTAAIRTTFSQPMDPVSLTPENFSLSRFPAVEAIAAAAMNGLALQKDGTPVMWGQHYYGPSSIPEGLSGLTAIATGDSHSLGLRADGTVIAWGYDSQNRLAVPPGLTNFSKIAAGSNHSLAVTVDGAVFAWGQNAYGESSVPPGLSGVVSVAAGYAHSLALKSDGTVVGWGMNTDYYGQHAGQATVPADLAGVVAIAAGPLHSVALKADGTVVAWGSNNNYSGQYSGQATVPAGLGGVVAIAAGGYQTLALKNDGSVTAWGQAAGTPPAAGIAAIAAGDGFGVALRQDGSVTAWGDNMYGQTQVPLDLAASSPPVSGAIAYDSQSLTASLTPAAPLEAGVTYYATISGVRNQNGLALAVPYRWNFTTESAWESKAPLPLGLSRAYSAVANGEIYVLGGSPATAAVQRYSPAVDSWSINGSLPLPLFGGAAAASGPLIYLAGGFDAAMNFQDAVLEYNTDDGSTRTLGTLTVPRARMNAAIVDNKLYVVGGSNANDSIEVFDLATNTGGIIATIPEPTELAGVVAVGTDIYIIGGGADNTECWRFDTTSNTFATLASLPVSVRARSALYDQGRILVVDGWQYNGVNNVLEYAISSDIWKVVTTVPTVRDVPMVEAVEGILYVIGGDQTGAVNEAWNFRTASPAETMPPQVVAVTPAPWQEFVDPSTTVTVTFSEAVDPFTVGSTTLYLNGPNGIVAGTWSANGAIATFTPATALAVGTTYYASVAGVRDQAGNVLPSPYYWNFTTTRQYTVSATAIGNGVVDCHSPVYETGSCTCTITPDAGQILQNLTDNGTDVLASVIGGVYTIDRVVSNHAVVATFIPAGGTGSRWEGTGPSGTNVSSVTPSPAFAADRTVFASTYGGLYKSMDAGITWSRADNGINNLNIQSVVVSSGYATDRTLFAGTWGNGIQGDGVFRSSDGGSSWSPVNDGLGNLSVYTLAISPSYPSDNTLFAGTYSGVYRSSDGGATWSASSGSIATLPVRALAISSGFASDRTIFAGTDGSGIFKSTDGGSTWIQVNGGLNNRILRSLAISPAYATDQTVFAGTYGGGVFRSGDGGTTWVAVNNGITGARNYSLAISPDFGSDQTIFAGTENNGVFRSTNSGTDWGALNAGLSNLTVKALAIAPGYPAEPTVFAGTGAAGVFRLKTVASATAIAVMPSSHSFGEVHLNTPSSREITITNTGWADLVVTSMTVVGADGTVLTLSPGGCGSLSPTLPPGTGCSVTVTFTPVQNGVMSAELAIASNDPASPTITIPLNGAGISPIRLLSVTLTGDGTGAVHSTPSPDIACYTGACSQSFPEGTNVTLTATPAAGFSFTGWAGACTGLGPCQLVLSSDKIVTARFSPSADTTAPSVTTFFMPPTATSLTVAVTSFTATDDSGVNGYAVTENPSPPAATAPVWSATPHSSYTFLAPGNCYAYAWARDAAGNVSAGAVARVTVTLSGSGDTIPPLITSFVLAPATSLTAPITTLAVTDNIGVTGYIVSDSPTSPPPDDGRWTGTLPTGFTFTSFGSKTVYAWARDAAGNVSAGVAATVLLMDPALQVDTVITGWPANPMPYSPSTFLFTANRPDATFECALDDQPYFACASPASFGGLANGSHTFRVRARDSEGNADPSPAGFTWTVNAPLARVLLSTYTSVTSAYQAVGDGETLEIKGMEFSEDLDFTRPVAITLKGGFDSSYLSADGASVIHGSISISEGTVTMENITIM